MLKRKETKAGRKSNIIITAKYIYLQWLFLSFLDVLVSCIPDVTWSMHISNTSFVLWLLFLLLLRQNGLHGQMGTKKGLKINNKKNNKRIKWNDILPFLLITLRNSNEKITSGITRKGTKGVLKKKDKTVKALS